MKLLAHMGHFYQIYPLKNARYWRRMITPEGAITSVVLFKNMEIPFCLENLYDYLKENGMEQKVRVMFHLFFTICFPRHKDMPKYYQVFKNLMIKMENDIKSAPEGVYAQEDIDLCNLLIYTDNFFQFTDLYFRPIPTSHTKLIKKIKLLGIPFLKIKINPKKQKKYYLFSIPIWSIRYKQSKIQYRLFCVFPIVTIQIKEKCSY